MNILWHNSLLKDKILYFDACGSSGPPYKTATVKGKLEPLLLKSCFSAP